MNEYIGIYSDTTGKYMHNVIINKLSQNTKYTHIVWGNDNTISASFTSQLESDSTSNHKLCKK